MPFSVSFPDDPHTNVISPDPGPARGLVFWGGRRLASAFFAFFAHEFDVGQRLDKRLARNSPNCLTLVPGAEFVKGDARTKRMRLKSGTEGRAKLPMDPRARRLAIRKLSDVTF